MTLAPLGEDARHAPEGDAYIEASSLVDLVVKHSPQTASAWQDVSTLHTAHMKARLGADYVAHDINGWKRTFLKKVRTWYVGTSQKSAL